MSVFGLTQIPYFTAYLIHYFCNSKISADRKKGTSDSESASKNTLNKTSKIVLFRMLLNSSITENMIELKSIRHQMFGSVAL